jgi:DNA polymerase-1
VVDPRRRGLVGEADVIERFGVTPAQWCDFRALAGDPSDGIPGLAGVGASKAAALLAGGKTLDDVRDVGAIADAWHDLSRWRELIRCDTDVDIGFEASGVPTGKLPSASVVCAELGLVDRRS